MIKLNKAFLPFTTDGSINPVTSTGFSSSTPSAPSSSPPSSSSSPFFEGAAVFAAKKGFPAVKFGMNGFVPKLKTGEAPNGDAFVLVVDVFGVVLEVVDVVVVVVVVVLELSLLSDEFFAGSLGEAALSNKLGPPAEGKADKGGRECSVLDDSFGTSNWPKAVVFNGFGSFGPAKFQLSLNSPVDEDVVVVGVVVDVEVEAGSEDKAGLAGGGHFKLAIGAGFEEEPGVAAVLLSFESDLTGVVVLLSVVAGVVVVVVGAEKNEFEPGAKADGNGGRAKLKTGFGPAGAAFPLSSVDVGALFLLTFTILFIIVLKIK